MTLLNDAWLLDIVARQRLSGLRQEGADERLARRAAAESADELESTWREAFPGVEFRSMAGGPEMMIVLMRFQRGGVAALHHHASAQAGYVLEGRIRITLPDEQLTVAAGECYLLPPGVPHQVRALQRTHVLDFFAPGEAVVEAADVVAGQPAARAAEPRDELPATPAAPRRRLAAGFRPGRARHTRLASRGFAAPGEAEPRDAA